MRTLLAAIILLSLAELAAAQSQQQLQRDAEAYIAAKNRYDAAIAAGRYTEAVDAGRRMVTHMQRVAPTRLDLIGNQWNWLGVAERLNGNLNEAERCYGYALSLRERAHGPDHLDVAETLSNQANLFRILGRYDESELAARRSIEIRERLKGMDDPLVAYSVAALAAAYFDQGRFDDAEPLLRRALAIDLKAYGASHERVATDLANLAAFLRETGQLHEAVRLDEQSLSIRAKLLGAEHPDTAMSMNNLAVGLGMLGRYADAARLYDRALSLREKVLGPTHPEVIKTLNNLAVIYGNQGRHAEATVLYERALDLKRKLYGKEHADVALGMLNMATCYVETGRDEDAIRLLTEALDIQTKVFGAEGGVVGATQTRLATIYARQGRVREAESLHRHAIESLQRVFGARSLYVADAQVNLCDLLVAQQRYQEAREIYDRTIGALDEAGAFPGARHRLYLRRAMIAWGLKDRQSALADLERAIQLAEEQRSLLSGSDEQRSASSTAFQDAYELAVTWNYELGDIPAAYEAAERARARVLIERMLAGNVDLLAGLDPAEASRLRERESGAKRRIAGLEARLRLAANQPSETRQQLDEQLSAARGELVAAFVAIRDASPIHRQFVGQDFKPAPLTEVQKRIVGHGGLVLQYFIGANASFVFVMPQDDGEARLAPLTLSESQALRLGVESRTLTSAVLKKILLESDSGGVLALLRNSTRSHEAAPKLAALYEVLFPPEVRDGLAPGAYQRLVILPDGPLALLPFETLVVTAGDTPTYLLDVAPPIAYAPSATVLARLMERTGASAAAALPVLSVGDPAYTAPSAADADASGLLARSQFRSGGGLASLPFSGQESRWVEQVFRDRGARVAALRGGEATESAVRSAMNNQSVVHLACHGIVDQAYGNLFGALAFSTANGSATEHDDGFLTMAEIYALDLGSCELAILSACDTNYGPEQQGEGVWSLSRGFLVAGARRTVASNWLVDDEAAASLISYFCAAVAESRQQGDVDHAAALHAAKRWVRNQPKWSSPYYWGTFVLMGPP